MHQEHSKFVKSNTRAKRLSGLIGLGAAAALAATTLVAPASRAATNPGTTVITTKTIVKKLKPPVVKVKNAKMYKGQSKVIRKGTAGKAVLTLNLHVLDGKVRNRELVTRVVLREPTPIHVAVGTKRAPTGNLAKWNRIAKCESGGNWSINTGNGYYGGLQFLASTWRSHGGKGMPHRASKMEQIRIAEKVRKASGGYGAWGSCGRR